MRSSDLATNSVQSADIKPEAVQSTDIGTGQVTPQDVTMPDPVQLVEADVASVDVGNDFVLIDTVGTYSKQDPTAALQVDWTGTVGSPFGTGCIFQLRVDKQPSSGGMTFLQSDTEAAAAISASALFVGLPAGAHTVEVWARQSPASPGTTRCVVGPASAGIPQTFVIGEQIV